MLTKIKCFFGFHDICQTSDLELTTCIHYCRLCNKALGFYVVGVNITELGFATQKDEDEYLINQESLREQKQKMDKEMDDAIISYLDNSLEYDLRNNIRR